MKLYGDKYSGNCYKVQLLLGILNIPCQWQDVDILKGETRNDVFLAKNPNGKIPLLELDDGRILAESNAILTYLATGSELCREDRFTQAQVMQWLFFEQYSHEPYIAVARYIARYLGMPDSRRQEYLAKQDGGHKALRIMEQQLAKCDYLVDKQLSIADIALYGYTHVADEGGFDLSLYPAIQAWIRRIQNYPGYLPMADTRCDAH